MAERIPCSMQTWVGTVSEYDWLMAVVEVVLYVAHLMMRCQHILTGHFGALFNPVILTKIQQLYNIVLFSSRIRQIRIKKCHFCILILTY
jgi:hypothetical protein